MLLDVALRWMQFRNPRNQEQAFFEAQLGPRSNHPALLLLGTAACLALASAFALNDIDHFHSPLTGEQNGGSSSSSSSSSNIEFRDSNPNSNMAGPMMVVTGPGLSGPLLGANLSCYACSTIDDIRCKYLNESIHAYFELLRRSGYDPNASSENHHEGLQPNAAPGTLSPGLLHHYNAFNNHHQQQQNSIQYGPDFTELSESGELNEESNLERGREQPNGGTGPSVQDASTDSNGGPSRGNPLSSFRAHCAPGHHYCRVIRLSVSSIYSAGKEPEFNFFALERSCAATCDEGCFIVGNGERTKLSICTTCCRENFCNLGNRAPAGPRPSTLTTQLFLTLAPFTYLVLYKMH